jgi:hypothetical protein
MELTLRVELRKLPRLKRGDEHRTRRSDSATLRPGHQSRGSVDAASTTEKAAAMPRMSPSSLERMHKEDGRGPTCSQGGEKGARGTNRHAVMAH